MKRLFFVCLGFAFGILAGGHPTLAAEWLTEEEMDGVTAGTAFVSLQSVSVSVLGSLQNVAVIDDTWKQTIATTLPDGGTAVTSTTISCNSSCTASTSVNLANGTSSTFLISLQ